MINPRPNIISFRIGGILGGMIKVLDAEFGAPRGYAKKVLFYKGQFSQSREGVRDTVKNALGALSSQTPLFIVCYAGGNNEPQPVADYQGAPQTYLHECSFVVFAVDADARGQEAQAKGSARHPGTIRMIGDATIALAGLQLTEKVGGAPVVLNPRGLIPSDTVVVDHLPNVTAYGAYFDTSFSWQSKNRLAEAVQVEELLFEVESTHEATDAGGGVGVQVEVG